MVLFQSNSDSVVGWHTSSGKLIRGSLALDLVLGTERFTEHSFLQKTSSNHLPHIAYVAEQYFPENVFIAELFFPG